MQEYVNNLYNMLKVTFSAFIWCFVHENRAIKSLEIPLFNHRCISRREQPWKTLITIILPGSWAHRQRRLQGAAQQLRLTPQPLKQEFKWQKRKQTRCDENEGREIKSSVKISGKFCAILFETDCRYVSSTTPPIFEYVDVRKGNVCGRCMAHWYMYIPRLFSSYLEEWSWRQRVVVIYSEGCFSCAESRWEDILKDGILPERKEICL